MTCYINFRRHETMIHKSLRF